MKVYAITKIWERRVEQNRVTDVFEKRKLFKKGTLSTEIEYYRNAGKNLKAFQNIVTIFKINSINFRIFLSLYVGIPGFVVVAYQFRVRL